LKNETKQLYHLHQATEAARRDENTAISLMALRKYAAGLLCAGRNHEAGKLIDEMFLLLRQDSEQQFDQFRASALILQAQCQLSDQQYLDAQHNLEAASDILEPMARIEVAGGVRSNLAECWSTFGKLYLTRGDHIEAIRAWQQAVQLRQAIFSLQHCCDVYTAYRQAGYPDEASQAYLESCKIVAALRLTRGE
jgi:tetratricopeptide (TPR) repeat protein